MSCPYLAAWPTYVLSKEFAYMTSSEILFNLHVFVNVATLISDESDLAKVFFLFCTFLLQDLQHNPF